MAEVKDFRRRIDEQILFVERLMGISVHDHEPVNFLEIRRASGRELALVRTKLQEAKMWAGKVLEALGNPFPPELADHAEGR